MSEIVWQSFDEFKQALKDSANEFNYVYFDEVRCYDGGLIQVSLGNMCGLFDEHQMRFLMEYFIKCREYIANGVRVP